MSIEQQRRALAADIARVQEKIGSGDLAGSFLGTGAYEAKLQQMLLEATEGAAPLVFDKFGAPTPAQLVAGEDPRVAYTGVAHEGLREALSNADTDAERAHVMTNFVGEGNWSLSAGDYVVKPKGMENLGLKPDPYGRPTAVDKPLTVFGGAEAEGFGQTLVKPFANIAQSVEPEDFDDVQSQLVPLAASTIAAEVAAPIVPGSGFAATATRLGLRGGGAYGGGAGGQMLVDEFLEDPRFNLETPEQQLERQHATGMEALYGETAAAGLARVARKVISPNRNKRTEIVNQLADEAEEMGLNVPSGHLVGNSLLDRAEGMIDTVLGGTRTVENTKILNTKLQEFIDTYTTSENPAERIVGSVLKKKQNWSAGPAERRWAKVFDAFGSAPVVPTGNLTNTAKKWLRGAALNIKGEPTGMTDATRNFLQKYADSKPTITAREFHDMRSYLNSFLKDTAVAPDVGRKQIRELKEALDKDLNALGTQGGEKMARAVKGYHTTKRWYGREREKFNVDLLNKLVKETDKNINLEPIELGTIIFNAKGKPDQLAKLVNKLTPMARKDLPGAIMAKLADVARDVPMNVKDELAGIHVLRGKKFKEALDQLGPESTDLIFGKGAYDEFNKFSRMMRLVAPEGVLSGGLVAASVALSPIKNLPKLVGMRIASKLATSKMGRNYLQSALLNPNTTAGRASTRALNTLIRLWIQEENLVEQTPQTDIPLAKVPSRG